jgi:hypothetical protein
MRKRLNGLDGDADALISIKVPADVNVQFLVGVDADRNVSLLPRNEMGE